MDGMGLVVGIHFRPIVSSFCAGISKLVVGSGNSALGGEWFVLDNLRGRYARRILET